MEIVHEEWRPIGGKFAGWGYEVSTLGRVRRPLHMLNRGWRKHMTDGVIATSKQKNGRLKVHLRHEGLNAKPLLHRVVAETFIPNTEGKPEVNHMDGNKLNNCAANLEWCTKTENLQHAHRNGLMVDMRTVRARIRHRRNGKPITKTT